MPALTDSHTFDTACAAAQGNKMENTDAEQNLHTPGFAQSALCFSGNLLIISLGLFVFELSLHSLMFFCLIWTGAHARIMGYHYTDIRAMMSAGISQALPAVYIFLLIGLVISAFMHSGTVASLIYHGLNLLSPSLFLVAGLVLCSLMSVATGTSWGTAGTLGIVLVGIGEAMAIPLPLVAGMVVCGATFGDKMSPVSDTTNLAAMSAGTSLYRHIGSMLYTTVPTYVLSLAIFLVLGLRFAGNSLPADEILIIREALAGQYQMNLVITLLPLILMLALSLKRYSAEVSMTASIVVAMLIAVFYQGHHPVAVIDALWLNTPGHTGIGSLDQLLGRGGMYSMSWTLLLSLLALALGGILFRAGFLKSLLDGLISKVHSTLGLIATTIATSFAGNLAMGEAYISIILNCQLFQRAYDYKKIDRAVLSRSVEEGSTMTTGLIPWTTAGAFYATTLGVPVLDYLPYVFFNYLNALVSICMAAFGIGLLRKKFS